MYLLAIRTHALEKCRFMYFAHLLTGLFDFFIFAIELYEFLIYFGY